MEHQNQSVIMKKNEHIPQKKKKEATKLAAFQDSDMRLKQYKRETIPS